MVSSQIAVQFTCNIANSLPSLCIYPKHLIIHFLSFPEIEIIDLTDSPDKTPSGQHEPTVDAEVDPEPVPPKRHSPKAVPKKSTHKPSKQVAKKSTGQRQS